MEFALHHFSKHVDIGVVGISCITVTISLSKVAQATIVDH